MFLDGLKQARGQIRTKCLAEYCRLSMIRILIVGAGIGGLTLARALAGLDCVIEVAERFPSFSPKGVGIVLHPNGLEVLGRLGLLEEINAVSNVVDCMELARGGTTVTIPLCEVWQGVGHMTRALLRSDLHDVLLRGALEAHPHHMRCRLSCRVLSIESRDSCVVAHFEDGDTQSYDLIVGADGVHSSVRQSLLPESVASSTNLFYFRWLAENVIGLDPSTWRTIERPDCAYGFIPVGRNRVHCFVQLAAGAVPCPRGEEASWLEITFANREPNLLQSLDARCSTIHADFAWTVRPAQWGVGQSVLIGDASHAVSPTLSQGGSLAMEDALVLAAALRESESLTQAIEFYRSSRKERVAWALRMSVAQLNSLRRGRPAEHTSAAIAISHLQHVYHPLRCDPMPKLAATSRLNPERDTQK